MTLLLLWAFLLLGRVRCAKSGLPSLLQLWAFLLLSRVRCA